MVATEQALCVHQQGQVIDCQVIGRGTMRQSPALRELVEKSLAVGPVVLRIDLRQCMYLDSTFLGTMVLFKRIIGRRGGQFSLVAPSVECCQLLKKMGMQGLFPITSGEDLPAISDVRELKSQPDDYAFRRNVFEAHQALASLPGPAGEIFHDAAAQLAEAWEVEKRRHTAAEPQAT